MFKIILCLSLGLIMVVNAAAQTKNGNVEKAEAFVELLGKKDFAAAESYFSAAVKGQLSAEKMAEVWNSIVSQAGNFKRRVAIKSQRAGEYEIVVATVEFEKANVDVQMSFDADGKMGGLFFRPASSAAAEPYKAPEYVNQNAFSEREVTIGAGEWILPATLSVPKNGSGKSPAVVLVHGSGPNDRDETHINPANKPFKDLALGLASKGVAVLRYEKRTKHHAAKSAALKNPTVKEETVDDALAAVEFLRKTAGIDPQNIYVLGHSLGGYLIPRIAARDAQIAGFISLAGATRPLEDIILEQHTYFAKLDGAISKDDQTGLDQLKQTVAQIKALNRSDLDSEKTYFGIPASYWLDLKNYNPPAEAKAIKQPILIAHGERDYQVTITDFQNWKTALAAHNRATFKSYAKLNHLFMPGEGVPSAADYEKTNHVAPEVINDIADWILRKQIK